MRYALIALVLSLVACQPPPAWEPGDDPLTYWCPDDETCLWFYFGAVVWRDAGLVTKRVEHLDDATIQVYIDQGEQGPSVRTSPTAGCLSDPVAWDYKIFIGQEAESMFYESDPAIVERAAALIAHDIGHVIGIWDDLPDGSGALMERNVGSSFPTEADLEALGW